MNALAKLDNAAHMLAEAKSLDEIKHIVDIAEAARTYARAAKLGLEAQNHAAELKLRAERKAGEMLAHLERNPGPGRGNTAEKIGTRADLLSAYRAAIIESDTDDRQARRWQAIAAVPEPIFERHIASIKAEAQELTTASVLRVAQQIRREQYHESMREAPPMPDDKFRVWYADPPWQYNDSGVITDSDNYGRAERHYPTLSTAALCEMGGNVRERCAEDAVLFLWATSPLLEDALSVIKAWGFQYKTSFVWDKVGHNYGHYNSVRHEFLLIATRGSCLPDERTLYDSVVSIPKSDVHSQKPEEFRRMIDSLYTWGRRIELFARESVEGWDTWGNQA